MKEWLTLLFGSYNVHMRSSHEQDRTHKDGSWLKLTVLFCDIDAGITVNFSQIDFDFLVDFHISHEKANSKQS